jgi:hypothetical protein
MALVLKKLSDKIQKIIKESKEKEVLEEIGTLAKDVIYKRTKAGRGLDKSRKTLKSLNPLSNNYKLARKDIKLGEFGSRNKSNLTLSGQMLNALDKKVHGKQVDIFIKNTARQAIKPTHKRPSQTNAQVANFVAENGRPFLGLADNEKKIVKNKYRNIIKAIVKKYFNL